MTPTKRIKSSNLGQKGEGIQLAKKYGVKGDPTLVFLNPDGSVSYQTSGFHNKEDFFETIKKTSDEKSR